jgi:aspartate/methionine/tyrosine aminotransferase
LVNEKTKLVIINSPSNPTGGVLTKEDLEETSSLLRDKAHPEFRVLSDEVYEEILFDGIKHESILSEPGMAERTILLNCHSKTFAMTGWRVGYAVLPSVEEADVFFQWNVNTYSCTPPFIQMAAKEALDNPLLKDSVAFMRQKFQQRRDVIIEALNRIDGFNCVSPQGAFYAFPNISGACQRLGILDYYREMKEKNRETAQPATLFQKFALYRHGVATLDRAAFGSINAEGQHFLRVSLASDLESLKEGVRRLEAASRDKDGMAEFIDNLP